jgi:hypothetical protein
MKTITKTKRRARLEGMPIKLWLVVDSIRGDVSISVKTSRQQALDYRQELRGIYSRPGVVGECFCEVYEIRGTLPLDLPVADDATEGLYDVLATAVDGSKRIVARYLNESGAESAVREVGLGLDEAEGSAAPSRGIAEIRKV